MVNGYARDSLIKKYEDIISLKKWMRDENYNHRRHIHRRYTQTGTAGAVEVEEPSGETIANIGKASETWIAQISAYAEDVVLTITWKNALGVETTQSVTLGDANETPFTVPITTGYLCSAASIDVVNPGGVTVKVGVTGLATPVATIQAAATVAVEADLYGTGSVGLLQKTDQVGTDGGSESYFKYRTPWGEKKYMLGTLDATDTTTVTRPLVATYVESTKTFTATTETVKDFYRLVEWESEMATTDELLLTDRSGAAAVYKVIAASYSHCVFTRYMTPYSTENEHAFLAGLLITNNTASIVISLTYHKKDDAVATTESLPVGVGAVNEDILREPVELEPLSEVYITVIGNTAVTNFDLQIIEGIKA